MLFFTKIFIYGAVTPCRTYGQTTTHTKYLAIASVIATIPAGLQLLKTTLQGEKPSAGVEKGLPKTQRS